MSEREELAELLQQYYTGFDRGDATMAAEIFTDDARMSIEIRGKGKVGEFNGRREIHEMLASTAEAVADDEQRRHLFSGMVVRSGEADELVVDTVLVVTSAKADEIGVLTSGEQRDIAVRTGQGWRLRSRELFVDTPF